MKEFYLAPYDCTYFEKDPPLKAKFEGLFYCNPIKTHRSFKAKGLVGFFYLNQYSNIDYFDLYLHHTNIFVKYTKT